jgi:putative transposase
MARRLRVYVSDVLQHVVQRGNNRQVCFFIEQDYAVYLDKLKQYAKQYEVAVHAYVLMTNHVHLLMTPTTPTGISQLMQSLGRYYVRYINQTHKRSGTLWEGRYKASLVEDEHYFLLVSRYIELNPVRANMVAHLAEYPWSSFQRNALGHPIALLTEHKCYTQLGDSPSARQQAYLHLFQHHIPEWTLQAIRNATNKAWALGSDRFIAQIEAQTGSKVSKQKQGGDRKSKAFKAQNRQ